jgi:pimeloyl-ACP methyl ester carboxylesterase
MNASFSRSNEPPELHRGASPFCPRSNWFRLLRSVLTLVSALAVAGCAHLETVTEIQPQRHGFDTRSARPLDTLDRYLGAAERAWQKLDRNPADAEARRDYNFAVARICGVLRKSKLAPWSAPIQVGTRTLEWRPDPCPQWNPALYELIPADQLGIRGSALDVREIKDGLGAPLVAKRLADQAHEFSPSQHFFYGVTAIARFEGSRCVLSIEDPLEIENVSIGQRTFPLAADFTAPLAMMLVEMEPVEIGLGRLLHPGKFATTTRVARLEPYNPDKTVVLFVHGLMSSATTWFPLINHLRADEDVRRNYQFWFFSYPSGYPYPYSAAILRRELDHVEKNYPMRKKMVVVAHSMGGCISRLLITDSGQLIWDQMYTVPPEKMDLTPEHKHIVTECAIFEHRPEIGRVIFISTPHRGSNLASGWLARLGSKLVQLPAKLLSTGREEARYQKHAAGEKHIARFPDSVDTLAPSNDFVRALHTVPIKPGIPYHTIAGDRGRGDSPKSSDGLVPYWSSHLPDAQSETIVPSGHSAHQNPRTHEELHRILTLHSRSNMPAVTNMSPSAVGQAPLPAGKEGPAK